MPTRGTSADEESLRTACWLANRKRSVLYLLYVIRVPRSFALDAEMKEAAAQGERALERIELLAHKEKCKAETEIIQVRDVGPAIVAEAIERKADLIVMGITLERHRGDLALDDEVAYVLKYAPCPVWLCRGSLEEAPVPEAAKSAGEKG